jgi:hypothetical protein
MRAAWELKTGGAWLLLALLASTPTAGAPIDGIASSHYEVPGSRTVSGNPEKIHTRGVTLELLQAGVAKATAQSSPFAFKLDEVETTFRGTTSVPNVLTVGVPTADDKLGAPHQKEQLNTAPFPRTPAPGNIPTLTLNIGSTEDANAAAQTTARAFSVANTMTTGRNFVSQLGETQKTTQVIFPSNRNSYREADNSIRITLERAPDWDILLHEFGHATAKEFGFLLPAGGEHKWGRESSASLAFNEGFASYFALAAQRNDPTIPGGLKYTKDTIIHRTTGPAASQYQVDLEGSNAKIGNDAEAKLRSKGLKDELSVGRLLWDLYDDTPNEVLGDNLDAATGIKDTVLLGAQKIWALLKQTAQNGIGDFLARVAAEVVNGKLGNVAAQIAGLAGLGNVQEDHGFGATVGGVVSKRNEANEPTLEFSWRSTVDSGNEGFSFGDVDIESAETGVDANNFVDFKLLFFTSDFTQPLFETAWFSADSLRYDPSTNYKAWFYDLSRPDYDALLDALGALNASAFGWAVLTATDSNLARPDSFINVDGTLAMNPLQGIWGGHAVATVPEPSSWSLVIAVAAGLLARRRFAGRGALVLLVIAQACLAWIRPGRAPLSQAP